MRVGLYLQDKTVAEKSVEKQFWEMIKQVRNSRIDLLVFPETAYAPFENQVWNLNLFEYPNEESQAEAIIELVDDLARKVGCAVVYSGIDRDDVIFSCFVNPFAKKGETEVKLYYKHVATNYSAFDLADYDDIIDELFEPILLNGFKIGLLICYDSNFPLFARSYGKNGIDVLINSTGGHVDYKKWSYYQKARAIENRATLLCTMSYYTADAKNNSYIFAYDKYGKTLPYKMLWHQSTNPNPLPCGVYEVEILNNIAYTPLLHGGFMHGEIDPYFGQARTLNKHTHFFLNSTDLDSLISHSSKLSDNLYIKEVDDVNLVVVVLEEEDVLFAEKVASLFYDDVLSAYPEKRYLLINRWKTFDLAYYQNVLSTILKVRSAENFCAVAIFSNRFAECFQVGNNKNIQIIECQGGKFGLDFNRMTGPEAIWQNKSTSVSMRRSWRNGYKNLIKRVCD